MLNSTTTWNTGSKTKVDYNTIILQIKEHSKQNGTVYIGTDSFFIKNKCIFATAICLYGADKQQGGRYFFTKTKLNKKQFPELSIRMIKEAENTINLANDIIELDDAGNWVRQFDADENTLFSDSSSYLETQYVTNETTGIQFKWLPDQGFWVKSYEGFYAPGTWSIKF